jgi:hypothetical protein
MKKITYLLSLFVCFIAMSCNSEKGTKNPFISPSDLEKYKLKDEKNIVKLLDNGTQYCFYVDENIIVSKKSLAEYLSKNYKGKSINFVSEFKMTPKGIEGYINFFRAQGVNLKGFFVPTSYTVEYLNVLPGMPSYP